MNKKKLLMECEDAYLEHDYRRLIELCDEILEADEKNPIAISYKSIAYCFLNQPQKAADILKEAIRLYPNNYYMNNNIAMAYYDLGEYEESLKYCEKGLAIKDFRWLYENKIKALIKLERINEAIECYESAPDDIDIYDLLIGDGKISEALKYCGDKNPEEFYKVIDKAKRQDASQVGDYYIRWIYAIKSKSDKGCEGLEVECDDEKLKGYVEYKIGELNSRLKGKSIIYVRSLDELRKELKGFDDEEFNAFISHLEDLDYIRKPREGYVCLTGYDGWKWAKEYLDEGKFAAPRWLVYPNLSAWTIGWRMGYGENYVMNEPPHTEEFRKLFPMPKYWHFRFSESPYKPHPPIGFFWNEDGKPKYPNSPEGIEVNSFITMDDEKEFTSDTFRFISIANAEALSKSLHFEKYGRRKDFDSSKDVGYTPEEERIWDIYRYSVILNASYFKIMQDEELKGKLLETGDEPLIYVSDDEENLFGRALMELRDEIRRLCKNENLIDWGYTEYLKFKPWM